MGVNKSMSPCAHGTSFLMKKNWQQASKEMHEQKISGGYENWIRSCGRGKTGGMPGPPQSVRFDYYNQLPQNRRPLVTRWSSKRRYEWISRWKSIIIGNAIRRERPPNGVPVAWNSYYSFQKQLFATAVGVVYTLEWSTSIISVEFGNFIF